MMCKYLFSVFIIDMNKYVVKNVRLVYHHHYHKLKDNEGVFAASV